jgi:hypothetical protein
VTALQHNPGRWVIRASPSGGHYSYWMPPVPRIADEFLDCAIYLYASEKDAELGERSGGSGFLVGIPTVDLSANLWITYAVSNKHVIESGNSVIRMRTKAGRHFIMPIDERAWTFHPQGDDLAISLIRFDWQSMRFNFVPRSGFLDKSMLAQFNIGVGDETFVVGRFINHEGRQQNLPTARFGCIAQMPIEPVNSETGFQQESFLVESRSIGGYSGSPVFVEIPKFSIRWGAEDWFPSKVPNSDEWAKAVMSNDWGYFRAHGPWLLGVDWGHINDWQPVCDAAGRPVDRGGPPWKTQVPMNTGIMTVIPTWKLIEMLDEGPISEQRKDLIDVIRQRQEAMPPPVATQD